LSRAERATLIELLRNSRTTAEHQLTKGRGNMTTIRTANHAFAHRHAWKALTVALWTLQVLVTLAFAAAGSGKLLGSAAMIALFDAVGIGSGSDTSPDRLKCWAHSC